MTLSVAETLDVSVLVPAKDEAANLTDFVRLCAESLVPAGFSLRGRGRQRRVAGRDRPRAARARAQLSFLRVVTHRRQRGIADALRSASDVARGDVFVFYPADLQYLPEDIPRLVEPILHGRADIVTGTKQGKYEKAFVAGSTTPSAAGCSASGSPISIRSRRTGVRSWTACRSGPTGTATWW